MGFGTPIRTIPPVAKICRRRHGQHARPPLPKGELLHAVNTHIDCAAASGYSRQSNAVVGGLIGGALSPSRAAPADEIGASPFNESNADLTISGSGDDNVEQSNETDDNNIARSAAENYAEDRTMIGERYRCMTREDSTIKFEEEWNDITNKKR